MPTRHLITHTPVFFRTLPVTENTPTNAIFNRYMDTKLEGEEIVEVHYDGGNWTCKESEALTQPQAMVKLAEKLNAEVESAKAEILKARTDGDKITQPELAEKLGMGVSALCNRLAIIKTFLPKPQQ